jgi:hypothetical protein
MMPGPSPLTDVSLDIRKKPVQKTKKDFDQIEQIHD